MGLLELGSGEIVVFEGQPDKLCFVKKGKVGFYVEKPKPNCVKLGDTNYRKKRRNKTESHIIDFDELKEKHSEFKKWMRHTLSLIYSENGKNNLRIEEGLTRLNKAKYVHTHFYHSNNWFSILMEKTNTGYKIYSLNEIHQNYCYRRFSIKTLERNFNDVSKIEDIIKNILWEDKRNDATYLNLKYNSFYLIPKDKAEEFIKNFNDYRDFYAGLYTE